MRNLEVQEIVQYAISEGLLYQEHCALGAYSTRAARQQGAHGGDIMVWKAHVTTRVIPSYELHIEGRLPETRWLNATDGAVTGAAVDLRDYYIAHVAEGLDANGEIAIKVARDE